MKRWCSPFCVEGAVSRATLTAAAHSHGTLLGGGLALIAADLQRLHVLRELERSSRPRPHLLLHGVLVLAQDTPTRVAANHIHEYADLPGPEGSAMQVPTKQFLDQLIELCQ